MSTFSMVPGGMKLTRPGGPDVFDTARKAANLIPDAALSGTVSLPFPNFLAGTPIYRYSGGSRNGNGKAPFAESCATYGTIARQEWGPGKANNIARIGLGAVPSGVDHLDVQVRLAQTAAPGTLMGYTIQKIGQNQWMSLSDNFAVLEDGGWLKRGIHFEIIGNQAYVSRYQSAAEQAVRHLETKTNLNVFYTEANPPFPETVYWAFRPGDNGACSTAFTPNLASTWSLTYVVTPGRTT